MEHFFDLPVTHKGEELLLRARLATFGFTYKFYVIVNGEELIFERDDEGEFRAIAQATGRTLSFPPDLLNSVISSLESLYKK